MSRLSRNPRLLATPTLLVTVLLVAALSGCGGDEAGQVPPPPLPVQTVTVAAGAGAPSARYPVTLVRDREANIAFRVAGTVDELPVRIGQQVQQGQLLARLVNTSYVAARTRAEAEAARLERLVRRNTALLPAGAVSQSSSEDSANALAAATAAVDAARYDEESALLRAPFAGVVMTREAEVGETVLPGQRIFRIADRSSPLLARAAVPLTVARTLRAGAAATVFIGPEGRKVTARVLRIGTLSDARTATQTVELRLLQADDLPSGAVGSVRFEARPDAAASTTQRLPPEALLEATGEWGTVFVVELPHSVARRTRVRLLGFDGEWLRVEGLPADARVITAGAGFVVDGQPVREVTP